MFNLSRILARNRVCFVTQVFNRQNYTLQNVNKSKLNTTSNAFHRFKLNERFLSVAAPEINLKIEKTSVNIVDSLKSDCITNKRVKIDKLEAALKLEDLVENQLIFLLHCCGSYLPAVPIEKRMTIVDRIWEQFNNPSLEHYKILLNIHRENKIDVKAITKYLEINPDVELFEKLISASCEVGNIAQNELILDEMKKKNFSLNLNIYNSLILGYSRAGNLSGCQDVFDTLHAANIQPNSGTYSELIKAYFENKNVEKAEKLINEKGVSLDEQHVVEILKSSLFSGNGDLVPKIVNLLPKDTVINPLIDPAIRNVCSELLLGRKIDEIITLLNSFPVPIFKLNEDRDIYGSFLLQEMIIHNLATTDVLKITSFLRESKRNDRSLHVAAEMALRYNPEKALELLKPLSKLDDLRPHYFWPLIIHYFRVNGESGILKIIKHMHALNVELDFETINIFILPKLSLTLRNAKKAIKIFEDCGVKMSQLLTPFTSNLLYQQRFEDVIEINKLYSTKLNTELLIWPLTLLCSSNRSDKQVQSVTKLIKIFNDKCVNPSYDLGGHILLDLLANNKVKQDKIVIKKLLAEFSVFGVQISKTALDMLQQHFEKEGENIENNVNRKLAIENVDTHILHPRDMNLEQLECHLVELESKNLNTRGVLRRMLQMCVRENKLDRALEIKNKCDVLKVDLSSGMMASCFDLNIKKKLCKEAGEMLLQIHKTYPGFLIDDHKIIDYAALLIENDEIEKAKAVLKQRAAVSRIKVGLNNHKNLWNLLNNVASYSAIKNSDKIENETEEMFKYLIKLRYCTPHNTLLGPIIREHILKHQYKLAIEKYKQFVKQYKKTPLQLELITLLVKLSNSNESQLIPSEAKLLLEELVKISASIHGQINTNNTLVIALAEAGTEGQLRRILMNPEAQINSDLLVKQCEYLLDNSKLDAVLKLAKCSRNLPHTKESDLLNLILNHYARTNDAQSAMDLFDRLLSSGDDFKINNEFAKNLSNLLQRNNLEVPGNVKLYV